MTAEPDPAFSRALVAWFDQQPEHVQDQIQAHFRELTHHVNRMCEWVEVWQNGGVDAAEDYANGDRR